MPISYVTGDLLDAPQRLILQSVNAKGAMNSGVAKAIRQKYPKVYTDYRKVFDATGLKLGTVIYSDCGQHIVGNIVGQATYGREEGRRYVSYDALDIGLTNVNNYCVSFGFDEVAMPLMGAQLGGGRWPIVAEIINARLIDVQPIVYLLDGIIPN